MLLLVRCRLAGGMRGFTHGLGWAEAEVEEGGGGVEGEGGFECEVGRFAGSFWGDKEAEAASKDAERRLGREGISILGNEADARVSAEEPTHDGVPATSQTSKKSWSAFRVTGL